MPVSQGDGKHRDSLPHELCNAPRGNISRYITLDISFHHDQLCREWVLIQLLQSNHPFGNLNKLSFGNDHRRFIYLQVNVVSSKCIGIYLLKIVKF